MAAAPTHGISRSSNVALYQSVGVQRTRCDTPPLRAAVSGWHAGRWLCPYGVARTPNSIAISKNQRSANAQLAADNLRLKGLAEWAESDVAAEQAARERLGMAREGEIVLLPTVVLPTSATATVPRPHR